MSGSQYYIAVDRSGDAPSPPVEITGADVTYFGAWGPIALPTVPRDRVAAFRGDLGSGLPHGKPWRVVPLKVPPSVQYPRMWRDGAASEPNSSVPIAGNMAQIVYMIGRLEAIFQVVEPSAKAATVWGHEIRNLMLIACTEVEAQLRAILQANNYKRPRRGKNPTMEDYVELKSLMKLDQYVIGMRNFPSAPPIEPFKGWSRSKPLRWYQAYNSVKHDRERNFADAQLRHAISAVTACVALTYAQFGWEAATRTEMFSFFDLKGRPIWKAEERYYTHPKIPWALAPFF